MRIFAQKLKQGFRSAKSAIPALSNLGHTAEIGAILRLQRMIGNQAVQSLLQANLRDYKADSTVAESGSFDRDLSRVPANTATPAAAQRGARTGTPANSHLPATDKPANDFERATHGPVPIAHDFGALRIHPLDSPLSHVDLPGTGGIEQIVDEPPGGGPAPPPAPIVSEGCGQPRSMNKLTSGAFLGGLTMDSYYPDLAGGGFYNHPGTGGAFDTGSRAGANIQLYGVIPSPCLPGQYTLAQTVTRTRFRINGSIHPEEGRTFDDIAKSGRDYTRPPARQDFLGGGAAPLGYIISMADPPSTGYSASDTIEHDRSFVTSLIGPSGRQSVSWSLSTRISGGVVTSNVLT